MHALHLQRKYCRITPNSKSNTFKQFQEWLKDRQPTDEDFETALREEEGLYGGATNELRPSSPPVPSPTYSLHDHEQLTDGLQPS